MINEELTQGEAEPDEDYIVRLEREVEVLRGQLANLRECLLDADPDFYDGDDPNESDEDDTFLTWENSNAW